MHWYHLVTDMSTRKNMPTKNLEPEAQCISLLAESCGGRLRILDIILQFPELSGRTVTLQVLFPFLVVSSDSVSRLAIALK